MKKRLRRRCQPPCRLDWRCPPVLRSGRRAPASGQGKTTVTAALARLHVRQGGALPSLGVARIFLDPQIHAVASGRPCHNLDPACVAKLTPAGGWHAPRGPPT